MNLIPNPNPPDGDGNLFAERNRSDLRLDRMPEKSSEFRHCSDHIYVKVKRHDVVIFCKMKRTTQFIHLKRCIALEKNLAVERFILVWEDYKYTSGSLREILDCDTPETVGLQGHDDESEFIRLFFGVNVVVWDMCEGVNESFLLKWHTEIRKRVIRTGTHRDYRKKYLLTGNGELIHCHDTAATLGLASGDSIYLYNREHPQAMNCVMPNGDRLGEEGVYRPHRMQDRHGRHVSLVCSVESEQGDLCKLQGMTIGHEDTNLQIVIRDARLALGGTILEERTFRVNASKTNLSEVFEAYVDAIEDSFGCVLEEVLFLLENEGPLINVNGKGFTEILPNSTPASIGLNEGNNVIYVSYGLVVNVRCADSNGNCAFYMKWDGPMVDIYRRMHEYVLGSDNTRYISLYLAAFHEDCRRIDPEADPEFFNLKNGDTIFCRISDVLSDEAFADA